jgi:hypothetical protein
MSRVIVVPMLGALLLGCGSDEPLVMTHPSGARADDAGLTEWAPPVNLGAAINTGLSEAQLGIAPNGKSLYVATPRAGGFGDADIWVSSKQPDGTWGPLVNLGPTINSSALEASPTS